MKAFLRDWRGLKEHRIWQRLTQVTLRATQPVAHWANHWLQRCGISPRVAQAGGVSLGAHCFFFILLALSFSLSSAGQQALLSEGEVAEAAEAAEAELEIAFHTTAAAEELRPEEHEEAPSTSSLPAEKVAAAAPEVAEPEAARGIITQLDPEHLKKAAEAPKDATFLASHHAEAASASERTEAAEPDEPTIEPSDEEQPIEFRSARLESVSDDETGSIAALGGWNKAVANAVGARWEHYRRAQVDGLRAGSVRLRFSIDARGRVSDVHILSNDAGSTNALYAVRSTTEAEIPPIPADRLARLPGGGQKIDVEYTFTIWPNS